MIDKARDAVRILVDTLLTHDAASEAVAQGRSYLEKTLKHDSRHRHIYESCCGETKGGSRCPTCGENFLYICECGRDRNGGWHEFK